MAYFIIDSKSLSDHLENWGPLPSWSEIRLFTFQQLLFLLSLNSELVSQLRIVPLKIGGSAASVVSFRLFEIQNKVKEVKIEKFRDFL